MKNHEKHEIQHALPLYHVFSMILGSFLAFLPKRKGAESQWPPQEGSALQSFSASCGAPTPLLWCRSSHLTPSCFW